MAKVTLGIMTICALIIQRTVCDEMIESISVPQYSLSGCRVNVSCVFHVQEAGLYSLKWYHNDTEFYRYVPTEKTNPVIIKPSLQFNAYEISRLDRQVILGLTRLTSDATGEYKCEVISEHPSFMTEHKSKKMIVVEEPPSAPMVKGSRGSYDRSDTVKLQCFSRTHRHAGPAFNLTWYIDGSPAPQHFVRKMSKDPITNEEGIELTAKAYELVTSGMSSIIECHLKIGYFEVKASQPIAINVRKSNYLATFWSAGTSHLKSQGALNWILPSLIFVCLV